MPKQARLTAREAHKLLNKAGFVVVRIKGSHHIYMKGKTRVNVPFHAGKTLHPKIVKQILKAIERSK